MINFTEIYQRALKSNIDIRIGNDDPSITYQEFVLYYILYFNVAHNLTYIDPRMEYEQNYKNGWIDQTWEKLSASKTHLKVFDKDWDKVF